MSLIREANKLTTSWRSLIIKLLEEDPKINTTYNEELLKFKDILSVYPPINQIFRCFDYFDINDTKIVILGQDPYHGPGQAIGLCFGVEESTRMPPSLGNIMKKLKEEFGDSSTKNTLENWAQQGVLMLNTALTVRQKTPTSHMKIWLPFTKKLIKHLSENYKDIVFVAWGAFAHRILSDVGENHHLIVSSHPSPLSAYRKYKSHPSFKEATPFTKINELILSPIEW